MQEINYEYYVSPEVAKLLKKAGFNLEVNHSYPDVSALDNSCSGYMEDLPFYHNLNDGKYGGLSAPTLEVAQRWLRKVKNYYVSIDVDCDSVGVFYTVGYVFHDGDNYNASHIWEKDEQGEDNHRRLKIFNTYEEAQEAGIKKALEIILEL